MVKVLLICGIFSTLIADVITDVDLWREVVFYTEDIQVFSLCLLASVVISYDHVKWKTFFFTFAAWRLLVIFLNVVWLPPEYSFFLIVPFVSLFLLHLWKSQNLEEIESREPENEACYYLIPVHTMWGVFQSVFLPWHYCRYETRAVSDGVHIWIVHKGKYTKAKLSLVNIQNAVKIPLGRHLSDDEKHKLNNLTGKRAIMGVNDCRKLFVAGPVRNFL